MPLHLEFYYAYLHITSPFNAISFRQTRPDGPFNYFSHIPGGELSPIPRWYIQFVYSGGLCFSLVDLPSEPLWGMTGIWVPKSTPMYTTKHLIQP